MYTVPEWLGRKLGWVVSVWLICDVLRPECQNFDRIIRKILHSEKIRFVEKCLDRPDPISNVCYESVLLIVQYRYLKSYSGYFYSPESILRTRLFVTGFISQSGQGVLFFFLSDIHHSKSYQITTNQPTNLNNRKSQRMGFSSQKNKIFGSKTKKIVANFCNRRIQTVRPRTFPTSPQGTEAHREEKRNRRICRYDGGVEFEASLETHVHVTCPWGSALSLRTVQKVLSLRTEQNFNAVTTRCAHIPPAACVEACTRNHTKVLILRNHVVLTRGSNMSLIKPYLWFSELI